MKKGTKILIVVLVAVAVIAGGAAYTFRPLTFSQAVGGLKAEDIEKIELLDGSTGIVTPTTKPSDVEEIYNKICSVKLKAALPENRAGWSRGLRIYVKDADGYISYTCNYCFEKSDDYKGRVSTLLFYLDNSGSLASIIDEYMQKLA